MCWKGVGANRKRFECERCLNLTHINCTNISKSQQKQYTAKSTYKWTCYDCTLSLLPFYKQRDVEGEPSIEEKRGHQSRAEFGRVFVYLKCESVGY